MAANIYHRLNLNYNLPPDLEISLATTSDDLKAALHLVHQAYLAKGYTSDLQHQMRLTIFHAQPSTAVVVGKVNGKIVATGSLVVDAFGGIPSAKVQNLDFLRQNNLQIVEGSALAVDPSYRGANGALTLPLVKYLIFYAKNFHRADYLVATVNPKQERFYRDILLFDTLDSCVDSYAFVQGAPGTILGLDLRLMEERYKNYYGEQEAKSNLYQYMFATDFPQLKFPKHQGLGHLPRYLSPELLTELFISKEALIPKLSLDDLLMLRIQYSGPEYDSCFAQTFLNRAKFSSREERQTTSLPATYAGMPVQIKNISSEGCKIVFLPNAALSALPRGGDYPLAMEIADEKLQMTGKIIWQEHNVAGLKLLDPPLAHFLLLSTLARGRISDHYQEAIDYPTKVVATLNNIPVELLNLSISEMKVIFKEFDLTTKCKVNDRYFLRCHFQQQDFTLEVVITWINQYSAIIHLIGTPIAWEQALESYQRRLQDTG